MVFNVKDKSQQKRINSIVRYHHSHELTAGRQSKKNRNWGEKETIRAEGDFAIREKEIVKCNIIFENQIRRKC